MNRDLARRVEREFHSLVSGGFGFAHALVHNDLGLEHILVDAGRPVGLIDFESAWVGDPGVDYVLLHEAFGPAGLETLLDGRDLGDDLARRLWFYRWMGSVHAIIYGVREGVIEEREAGLVELERRLHDAP